MALVYAVYGTIKTLLVMKGSFSARFMRRTGPIRTQNYSSTLSRAVSASVSSNQAIAEALQRYDKRRFVPCTRREVLERHGAYQYDERWLSGASPHSAPQRVAVLLSGGVDSSLALSLLKAAGHQVHAFYLQIWFQEDFRNFWDSCPWEEDLDYAQKVCEQLDVPLSTVPLTEQYWDRVVSHCVEQIHSGRTPNPDVLCNSRVKFGAFLEYLENHPDQFDCVASGHYACIESASLGDSRSDLPGPALQRAAVADANECGTHKTSTAKDPKVKVPQVRLKLTPDSWKDQTYFLANLSQQQLQRVLFPLGHLTKKVVRELASAAQLPTMTRKDSQGICFLGKVKFSEFIKEHLGEWPGPVIEAESNRVVAMHPGFWFYTIGQRSGLDLGHLENGPWYVVRKDSRLNAVYVSLDYFSDDKSRDSFTCGNFNWISSAPPEPVPFQAGHSQEDVVRQATHVDLDVSGTECAEDDFRERSSFNDNRLFVKVRHGPQMYLCKEFQMSGDGSQAYVKLNENDQGLAAGQYAVFYQRGECLGCGVIE